MLIYRKLLILSTGIQNFLFFFPVLFLLLPLFSTLLEKKGKAKIKTKNFFGLCLFKKTEGQEGRLNSEQNESGLFEIVHGLIFLDSCCFNVLTELRAQGKHMAKYMVRLKTMLA